MTTTATPSVEINNPEWLAWRKQGIGASDIAGILGISPWASPWSVWADKMGLTPPVEMTEEMEAGHWLELAIGPWFAHRTGLHVRSQQLQCTSPDWPIARATLDGLVYESAGWISDDQNIYDVEPLGGLEIKTARAGKSWAKVPAHYEAQAQWQMFVRNLERVFLVVLMGRRLDKFELLRNDDEIEFMVQRAKAFHENHILTATPPDVDGHSATLRALQDVWPHHHEGKEVDATAAEQAFSAYRVAKANESASKKAADVAKTKVVSILQDGEVGLIDGTPAMTYREQSRTETCGACGHQETSTFRVLREIKRKAS